MVKDINVICKKNETIMILISLKCYFSHPEKSILNLSLLCLGYICYGRRTIYLSTIFSTIFSASLVAISYDVCVYITYDHLMISFGDKLGQNLSETLRISYDNRKVIVQSSC